REAEVMGERTDAHVGAEHDEEEHRAYGSGEAVHEGREAGGCFVGRRGRHSAARVPRTRVGRNSAAYCAVGWAKAGKRLCPPECLFVDKLTVGTRAHRRA